VQRWLKFAKYLPTHGWQPVVVTPTNPDFPVTDESLLEEIPVEVEMLRYPIREPYAWYRKLTGAKPGENFGAAPVQSPGLLKRIAIWIRGNFFIPDPRVAWVKPTSSQLIKYLKDQPVDAVVSTGPPHSVHLIGQAIKEAFPDVPWILDVRDPWSQFDVHLSFNPGKRARAKNARMEREALAKADVVLGTSYSMPTHLEPFDLAKFRTITNGYDESDFPEVSTTQQQDQFHLYHTGLLNAVRNPIAVWRALARLVRQDAGFAERLHIHLIGTVAPEVITALEGYSELKGKWTITPWIDHQKLVQRYKNADAFLLCPNVSDNARGQINGKLFEYLAARRPVLHIGPWDSDNTRILDQAHAGLTVPPGDVDASVYVIRELANGAFAKTPHAFNDDEIGRYSREATAGELAVLLDGLSS